MLTNDAIVAKYNIEMIARERGKLLFRRDTHNIFVSVGTEWLAQVIAGELSTCCKYMGVGIGGSKQVLDLVDVPPLSDSYPTVGARSQTDIDPLVTALERPVCITSTAVPITPGQDVWLKEVSTPTHPTPNKARFTCVFTESEISFGTFTVVPISEIGLFTSDKNVLIRTNQLVAYDTFHPISKTSAIELEVRWTVTF